MFQQSRTLAALLEDQIQLPAYTWQLTTTCNSSSRGFDTLFWPLQEHTWYTDINEYETLTHVKSKLWVLLEFQLLFFRHAHLSP